MQRLIVVAAFGLCFAEDPKVSEMLVPKPLQTPEAASNASIAASNSSKPVTEKVATEGSETKTNLRNGWDWNGGGNTGGNTGGWTGGGNNGGGSNGGGNNGGWNGGGNNNGGWNGGGNNGGGNNNGGWTGGGHNGGGNNGGWNGGGNNGGGNNGGWNGGGNNGGWNGGGGQSNGGGWGGGNQNPPSSQWGPSNNFGWGHGAPGETCCMCSRSSSGKTQLYAAGDYSHNYGSQTAHEHCDEVCEIQCHFKGGHKFGCYEENDLISMSRRYQGQSNYEILHDDHFGSIC
ncbi:Hibadh [Symbiodinium sp. CCMP2456]|nr:Hibadh [Symbiodinium sp. CCMP2456]